MTARRASAAEAARQAEAAAAVIPREVTGATLRAPEPMLSLHATSDLVAWLPRGESMRQRTATEARLAESAAETAREALAAARAAERAVELLRENQAAEMARKAARRSQAALDEMGARQATR
ncbi:flagellar FliJ family protein [Muricoccus vinaceus]|uniref:Flagellar FliJ protein n=1 Tax=Muricoccus vinaceus TaxID=424704 RepID=A0ABV6ISP9_9PROT